LPSAKPLPSSLHSKIDNPQSSIVNLSPSKLSKFQNRQSSIINHQSSIINHQSSIINHQSSIINHQSSIINLPMPSPWLSRLATLKAARTAAPRHRAPQAADAAHRHRRSHLPTPKG
jgi:hypothetical protein